MLTLQRVEQVRGASRAARRTGRSIGFVPTMGALHAGHRALMSAARGRCDLVFVSIFVNPMQFGPNEDFAKYPRTLEADLAACREERVDAVFTPETAELYPPGARTTVHVAGLTERLCGPFRPGHFDGVTTVVAKLFGIVEPDLAFFGEKDFQQLVIVQQMVRDLNLPVEIVACPTVREPDGLAMSSRNAYLSPDERVQASSLYAAMTTAQRAAYAGTRHAASLIEQMRRQILAAGPATIDYISIVDPNDLTDIAVLDRPARICLAVRIGRTRLIDNLPLDLPAVQR
ncbi:MAG TPA: pantoate--beta-alanine ligase [Phycisphaerae bacterium]|jgi:pantoate--beta-alanine ligase